MSAIELVIVGHFGFAEDRTPSGRAVNLGGSGYACAVGAGAGDPRRVGIVGNIGEDFDIAHIRRLGVDMAGAMRVAGKAPRLTITQYPSNERSFHSSLGVAALPEHCEFPAAYAGAKHVHLATMPPDQQLYWLRTVRRLGNCRISVDMFEQTALAFPGESRTLCYSADLVFMNQKEHDLLFSAHPVPKGDIILKGGADGAAIRSDGTWVHAHAPEVTAIDTTGAGEVLAGAYLSLRTLDVPIPDALRRAVEVASAKVTEFGVDGANLRAALRRVRMEVASALP